MKVETKFNVGDSVCFIYNNELHQGKVGGITISVDELGFIVEYSIGPEINGVIEVATTLPEGAVANIPCADPIFEEDN